MQPSLNIAFRQMTKNEKIFSLRPAISIFQIYFFISYNYSIWLQRWKQNRDRVETKQREVETKQRKGGNKTEGGWKKKTEGRWKKNRDGWKKNRDRWKKNRD